MTLWSSVLMSTEAFTIEAHRSSVSLRSVDNGCQILCVAISSAHSTSFIVFENNCSCSCSQAVCGPKLAYAFFFYQKFKQVSVWSVQSIDSLAYVSPRGIYLKPLNRRTRRRVRVFFPYKCSIVCCQYVISAVRRCIRAYTFLLPRIWCVLKG